MVIMSRCTLASHVQALGCWFIICCSHTSAQLDQNVTVSELLEDDALLPVKERFRRLIPYMTYYLDQNQNQFQAVQPVSNHLRAQNYYVPQYQEQKYQLVPVGYLVGGGYRRVPVYATPAQPDYTQLSYTPQNPSDLTRMIAQNYLAIAKQVGGQSKDQRPAQYTTKLHYADQNQHQNIAYKAQPQTKTYFPRRQQLKQNSYRQQYYQKNVRPSYTPLKDDSYVQLHSNYETNYNTRQNVKQYEPDPDVMTITKSQELTFPVEEGPVSLPALKPQIEYEQPAPTVPSVEQNSLLELLAGYQLTKAIPEKVTQSNLGYSIQTLSSILKLLQKAKVKPSVSQDIGGDNYDNGVGNSYSPYQTEGSTPGRAGIDYPALSEIPETQFTCKNQRYKGFFGDPETNCQVWHYCDLNGGQASFLCPNGTIFSQVALTCDWWFNVKCASTAQLYVLNERLYKYILPVKPSFPEDYAGPLVDEYLTRKFQELEAKKRNSTTEKVPSAQPVLLDEEVNNPVK
ncbi:hypothetical protein J6590_074243 [Homalodisca vitripennis]|nr:hypothetical protein J6590_074243 [Homalodisca vitripennis]